MKKYYLSSILICFVLFSCEKDETNDNMSEYPPILPETVYYDFNGDSINDFYIAYRWFTWDGYNCSGDAISGLIEPLNENSILLKQNEYTLFNMLNDTIRLNPDEPYYWEKYLPPHLVTISNSSVNGYLWPKDWRILSNKTLDSYYLGVTINENNHQLVGWIKLKIYKSSGSIQIIDKKYSSEGYIVIDK